MGVNIIDGSMLQEMYISGCANLNLNREMVDSLNVFPVPDGDTGTNMSQTMNAAIKEIGLVTTATASEISKAAAKGALKGARGNSGVITSQILRGIASALEGKEEVDVPAFANALKSGSATAYKAVMKPKEGTILTVSRALAEAAEKLAATEKDLIAFLTAVIKYGEEVLKRTPDMLPVLKQAGVVDSGGKGLMIIFHGFLAALSGKPIEADADSGKGPQMIGGMDYVDEHEAFSSLEDIKYGYCTEFIVSHPKEGVGYNEANRLRRRLERIGDCVIVVTDLSVVKVHVHTNDPGKAMQMALELGELDSIKVDNMREEHRERVAKQEAAKAKQAKQPPKPFGMVAVALGSGFNEIFKSLGVDSIVDGGQTMNPSIEILQNAIEATNAENVFVLPNNSNIILAAQQAAELTKRNVMVLPTKSVPMGISAALAFTPDADAETNLEMMNEAAANVHTASVTYAVRDTVFDGLEIKKDDIMGLLDNKVTMKGNDIHDVSLEMADRMITEDSGLATVYYGSDVTEEQAQQLADDIAEKHPDCEVEIQAGGQPLYYYIIAVE